MVDVPLPFRQVLSLFVIANMLSAVAFEYYLTRKSASDLRKEFLRMQFKEQSLRSSIDY